MSDRTETRAEVRVLVAVSAETILDNSVYIRRRVRDAGTEAAASEGLRLTAPLFPQQLEVVDHALVDGQPLPEGYIGILATYAAERV